MTPRAIGDVMHLARRRVDVDPTAAYREIGVRSFGRGIFHKPPVLGAELGNKKVFWIQPGDLVINIVFAWEGAVAAATAEEQNMCGSHRFLTYEVDKDLADPEYIRLLLLSDGGLALLGRVSPGSAGRNRTLNREAFEAERLDLPGVEEQDRFVKRARTVAEPCRALEGLQDQSRNQLRKILPAMAHRPDLSVDQKLGRGWNEFPLSELLRPGGEVHPVEVDRTYPNFGVLSFGRGLFSKPPVEGARTSARELFRVRAGQFVYSRLFAFEGAFGRVPTHFDGWFVSNEFPVFDCDDAHVVAEFLAAYFQAPESWAALAGSSRGLGLRRQRLHPELLMEHRLLVPPRREQDAFTVAFELVEKVEQLRDRQMARVKSIVPSLLNRSLVRALDQRPTRTGAPSPRD